MKTKIGILVLALCTSFFNLQAQQRTVTTTRATSSDISDNLDLDAVASMFGDSENLEDFERKLNDPNNPISNLDLNQDGFIDYLRVVENSSDQNSLVVIQAVLGDNVFQDVATIEVERVQNGNPRVQIVGDPYIYGSNYIIEPVFYHTPLIFLFFWGPRYSPWQSPYYWNNYPGWYSSYRPYSPFKYRRHIYAHINYENKYHRTDSRNIHFSGDNYDRIRRSDYASKYPDRAFVNRNGGIGNRNELIERRTNRSGNYQRNNNVNQQSDRVRSDSQNSGSNQNRAREYNSNPNNKQKNENRKDSYETRPVTERPSVSTPERSTNRVESDQRRSAPREKSGSIFRQNRSNKVVKQSQPSDKNPESSRKEVKKESENSRRR